MIKLYVCNIILVINFYRSKYMMWHVHTARTRAAKNLSFHIRVNLSSSIFFSFSFLFHLNCFWRLVMFMLTRSPACMSCPFHLRNKVELRQSSISMPTFTNIVLLSGFSFLGVWTFLANISLLRTINYVTIINIDLLKQSLRFGTALL